MNNVKAKGSSSPKPKKSKKFPVKNKRPIFQSQFGKGKKIADYKLN